MSECGEAMGQFEDDSVERKVKEGLPEGARAAFLKGGGKIKAAYLWREQGGGGEARGRGRGKGCEEHKGNGYIWNSA